MKKIISIICILLLTGCTVKSNITVNNDNSVTERVYTLVDNAVFNNNDKYFKNMVDAKIDNYKSVLQIKDYSYDYQKGKNLSGAKIYKNYDNICDYFGNSAFNQYVYSYIDCKENDYYYEIKNATEYIPYCPQCSDWPALDSVELKIELPIEAEEQNADEIDGNTYIWKYDKDTTDKDFYLKISKIKLDEHKKIYIENKRKQENRKKIIKIGIIASILVVIGIVSIIFYGKYKKNKLEY